MDTTIVRLTEGRGLRATLWRSLELPVDEVGTGIVRVRSADGAVAYVEQRGERWIVHLDGRGREASREHVCASIGAVLMRLRSELRP